MFLAAGLALMCSVALAQTSDSYIVKTQNVKKAVVAVNSEENADSAAVKEEEKAEDFIGKNFRFHSMCDWREGMKFMVMPEKYDLVVRTFTDASTGKEVSSMKLRHKIMEYKGHDTGANGKDRVNFECLDDNKRYYYELPGRSFEDHCHGYLGVPTLAYLGDVDIARELLEGKTLYTKTKVFRVDTEYEGDGYKEIVRKNLQEPVTVKRVGVGSRHFPVKIIVADEAGNEFYQLVAMSKTNCGMRDDEFIVDSVKHTFYGAFEMIDELMNVSGDISKYEGKTIHTVQVTPMLTSGDGKERTVKVPRMTTFTIEHMAPVRNTPYVMLSLKESESRRDYYVKVNFEHLDGGRVDADEEKLTYFGYLFAMGPGAERSTSPAARAAIRQGRVIVNMTEDEVILAMGEEPDNVINQNDGRKDWYYRRSQGMFIIHFGRNGLVESYTTPGDQKKAATNAAAKARK